MTDIPPEELKAIRSRHEALEQLGHLAHHDWASEAHEDRATLLPIAERCLKAEARVAEMAEALRPFAEFEQAIRDSYAGHRDTDGFYRFNETELPVGAFRRAAQTLKERKDV